MSALAPLAEPATAEQLLSAALRGDETPSPATTPMTEAVGTLAEVHGVEALLSQLTAKGESLSHWPASLVHQFATAARHQAVADLVDRSALKELVMRFESEGIRALLMKGSPLAYTHYLAPHLRPRGDTDILVPESQREHTHQLLLDSGYQAAVSDARGAASYQLNYTKPFQHGTAHLIDLHWRLSNRQIFARLFHHDELWQAAMPVPQLGSGAHALSPPHALVFACAHRATHIVAPILIRGQRYYEPNRLIWLYDIRLLCDHFTEADWTAFTRAAIEKNMRAVCLDGLDAAEALVRAPIPAHVRRTLSAPAPPEASANYLRHRSPLTRWMADVSAMPTLTQRAGLLMDYLFPPADHMLRKYNTQRRALLPFLYARRILFGLPKAGKGR